LETRWLVWKQAHEIARRIIKNFGVREGQLKLEPLEAKSLPVTLRARASRFAVPLGNFYATGRSGAFAASVQQMPNESVAIIGAGIAGLSAALRLRQAGANVTLFESSDGL
jgi:NADPH-dependent 2,4-dienoyl-CoA reductase/sulfur reductase-like enzyme